MPEGPVPLAPELSVTFSQPMVAVTSQGDDAPMTRAEIRRDRASGEFVQSLQHQTEHVSPQDYGSEKLSKSPPPSCGVD